MPKSGSFKRSGSSNVPAGSVPSGVLPAARRRLKIEPVASAHALSVSDASDGFADVAAQFEDVIRTQLEGDAAAQRLGGPARPGLRAGRSRPNHRRRLPTGSRCLDRRVPRRAELASLMAERDRRRARNRLAGHRPYPKQGAFRAAAVGGCSPMPFAVARRDTARMITRLSGGFATAFPGFPEDQPVLQVPF